MLFQDRLILLDTLAQLQKVKQVCLGRCYQIVIKTQKKVPKAQCLQGFGDFVIYSHSIVAGGFGEMS